MKRSAVILCAFFGTLGGLLITLTGIAAFRLAGAGLSRCNTRE